MSGPPIPFAAIALAVACSVILIFAGCEPALALGVMAVWIMSFWLIRPERRAVRKRSPEGLQLSQSGLRELIGFSSLPLLLIDTNKIIMANDHARTAFGDHIIGQDPRVALRHPAAVDLLSRAKGGSITVQGLTTPKSNWQMSLTRIDQRYGLIELVDRTSEADVSRAHTDFVANASHELRTPLASIIGYIETLAEDSANVPPDRATRFYATVLREARRLQSLVDDLMSLSRVEAEKHDQPRDRVDLVPLITQAAGDGAGPERQGRLILDLPSQALSVRGDHDQLEQLVRNLVDNALKYGRADSAVTITLVRADREMALLTVRDRGDGIAAEHIPHLTRRFYRTDPGRSRAAGGTGLGLAIVKHIVERHRGRLDIASMRGDGTTVSVRIPIAEEPRGNDIANVS